MTIRPKLFWRIALVALLIYGGIHYYHEFYKDGWGLREWFIIAMSPMAIYGVLFVVQTMQIVFSDDTIKIYWYVGFPGIKLWEHGPEKIPWNQVQNVFLAFPRWVPLTLVGVQCSVANKNRTFFLGSYMTDKKASIVYLANHIDSIFIDQEVKSLIEQYRKDLNQQDD